MSDDTDLIRLFAQTAELPQDEAFVAGVSRRIAARRRLAWAWPAGAAVLLLLAIWATWPAAYTFSIDALSGIQLLAGSLATISNSPAGMLTAAVLLLTAVLWSWLFERVRENRL